MDRKIANSELNKLIPPEIKNDDFYETLQIIAGTEDIQTVLEIGSSSGEGSTEALVKGLRQNIHQATLFCMEVSQARFTKLKETYQNDSFVRCYNISSVSLEEFPSEQEIIDFYNNTQTNLNFYPLELVLNWLKQDIEYVKNSGFTNNGIKKIKKGNNITFFDLVLIDGSEFTGNIELNEVYGAKFICLGDINTFKNYKNNQQLLNDPNYVLVAQSKTVRNGYSIFKKNVVSELPIHFFTIVLNGQPFIRYHIDVLKQLSFKWHWHIVEGVADLKHDTSWCLKLGGNINDEIHQNGLSYDGTTDYINELAKLYPDNITIYRKPEGIFWDGKREMVNAPLTSIQEECLLWQVDVDELWTLEQICTARQMFINNPDKTAAYYWCWYFVGENLIISTRNCYAQNPQQEWLRTWRFKPGAFWAAHEPPILVESLPNNQYKNIAGVNPFLHQETENLGLVFQHFSYVTTEQLKFKEQYYGYSNAIFQWKALQETTKFPVMLREYFPWVRDETQVDIANSLGILPIAQREKNSYLWKFLQQDEIQNNLTQVKNTTPLILVDGVFFQLYQTGIARVWKSLLEEWSNNGFAKHIIVLDRDGSAPKISGIRYRIVPAYDYNTTDSDREMLQQVCNQESASIFISSYYTTPTTTPSVFIAHDMIPELMGWDLNHPMWREKHYGIQHAAAYISVSENTAKDLIQCFPDISLESITIAKNGVNHQIFFPASIENIQYFKTKYGIAKPYFLIVGAGSGYKNSILFFRAFSQLANSYGFDIVLTGSGGVLAPEFRAYTSGSIVHMVQLSDEELAIAYSGAMALIYPSKYEGFGMPVLEALACGCPVITCHNASIPEVAEEAAIYVNDDDVEALANALCEVQKPSVRNSLITAGLAQSQKFSWTKMAQAVSSALIDATLLSLNLEKHNYIIFPDWNQPEESLGLEVQQVIKILAVHPHREKITLLIYISNIDAEEAAMFLSSIVMNLLMEEDLDISEGLEITPVGNLATIQWEALSARISARIVLLEEDKAALASVPIGNLKSYHLDSWVNQLPTSG